MSTADGTPFVLNRAKVQAKVDEAFLEFQLTSTTSKLAGALLLFEAGALCALYFPMVTMLVICAAWLYLMGWEFGAGG
jgi:hypothetical protein